MLAVRGVGKAYPGALLPVHPQDLSSVQAQFDYFVETLDSGLTSTFYQSASFNFHDLDGMPPASAYYAQPKCIAEGCDWIYSDYHPVLVLPGRVRNMDPAWKTCGLDWRGAWDPPIALHPAETVAAATTSREPHYTVPPSPHSKAAGPASQTATANDPTTTATKPETSDVRHGPSFGSTDGSVIQEPTESVRYTAVPSASTSAEAPDQNPVTAHYSYAPASSVSPVTTSLDIGPQFVNTASDPAASATPAESSGTAVIAPPTHPSEGDTSALQSYPAVSSTGPGRFAYSPDLTGTTTGTVDPAGTRIAPQQSHNSPLSSPYTPVIIEGQTVSAVSADLAVMSTTLRPGGEPLTISSAVYSANPDGGLVVVSNSYVPVVKPSPTNAYQVLSEAEHSALTAVAEPGAQLLTGADGARHTLVPEGGGMAIDGITTINVGETGSIAGLGAVSVGTSNIVVSPASGDPATIPFRVKNTGVHSYASYSGAVFTADGNTFTAYQAGNSTKSSMIVQGSETTLTLAAGRPGKLGSTQVVSLDDGGSFVIGSSTAIFSASPSATSGLPAIITASRQPPTGLVLTMGSNPVTAMLQSSGVVQVGNQNLTPGGEAATVDGHTISAVFGGVVQDGSTISFVTVPAGQSKTETSLPATTSIPSSNGSSYGTAVATSSSFATNSDPSSGAAKLDSGLKVGLVVAALLATALAVV